MGTLASWTLGINNHRMYYRACGDSRSDQHRQVASCLCRVAADLAASVGPEVLAAVQYGAESEDLLANRSLLDHLRSLTVGTGTRAIIHHPDGSTPGTPGFVQSLLSSLRRGKYLGSDWVVVHAPTGDSDDVFDVACSELTDESIVRQVRRSGVGVAVENRGPSRHGVPFGRIDVLASLVSRMREACAEGGVEGTSARMGICLDYGHLLAYEGTSGRGTSVIRRLPGRWSELVTVAHIHNNDGSGDQHLLLGERPEGVPASVLIEHESILLETIIPSLNHCRSYVIERNSPYEREGLEACAHKLAQAIESGAHLS